MKKFLKWLGSDNPLAIATFVAITVIAFIGLVILVEIYLGVW